MIPSNGLGHCALERKQVQARKYLVQEKCPDIISLGAVHIPA